MVFFEPCDDTDVGESERGTAFKDEPDFWLAGWRRCRRRDRGLLRKRGNADEGECRP